MQDTLRKLRDITNDATLSPAQKARYLSLEAEGDLFVPLLESNLGGVTYLRVAQRARHLDPIGDSDVTPFYDRLYGGGPAPKHRGFDRFDLGPQEVNANGFNSVLGGDTELLTTLELSFPIQGTNDGLRFVLFSDIGQVWGADENVSTSDMRYAVGMGLRFPNTFPVQFDFAWLLDREPGESSTQFHFTIAGFAF